MMNYIKCSNNTKHGSYKSYLIGFFFSVITTIIPFSMVMYSSINARILVAILIIFAIIQIIVHLICFLHINISSLEQQWNLIAFIFTIVIFSILVFGSMWIMWHLNYNLMT